ncbi:putative dockerin type 1 protein [Botrytis fragariae]|uniref:Putative dockerin type 1 protein n=1 Tax=Botrytis fragariae TaxID=1964551 RepID=A0A8H6B3V3_9HELO|nr:putative dockerin type 1 protein [Botrytis fragariae]KAF5878527.1 putative dockerin type 1 protein [Botrytis fragariae]
MGLPEPSISILGPDPKRTHRINANSFQQNAITTVDGWQYVAFYTDHPTSTKLNACMMNLGRRKVSPTPSKWEILSFHDYEQVVDDGHNTISIGICSGDGSIHIAFDHHCDRLRFKILKRIDSEKHSKNSNVWNASLFSQTQDYLPGIAHNELMDEVTYPRFVNTGDDLLLTYRIGQAGLGSDILYRYSSKSFTYTYLGQHLTGVSNNAHKQQAGPNGPENNYDLNFAYSEDVGRTWKSSDGTTLAVLDGKEENTILPQSKARVFEIPMGSGILNQEAQAVDRKGNFWVLNRGNSAGEQQWILYHRDCTGFWTKNAVPTDGINKPTEIGSRGSISVDSKNDVYLALPGNTDSTLSIVKVHSKDGQVFFDLAWSASGFDGEPSVEIQEVEGGGENLSIFTRTDKKEDGLRDVVVLDFDLDSKPI